MTAASKKKSLSVTMTIALAEAIEHGAQLHRHQDGYWTYPGAVMSATIGAPFHWWVGASTIEALIERKKMKYVEWKEGRGFRFPIVVEVVT